MSTTNNNNQLSNSNMPMEEEGISMLDLFMLYMSKWYWFATSLIVCVALAVVYLLVTPPVYTRSASILIKEDSKGKSVSNDVSQAFSELGFGHAKSNVNNEIISFQSPDLMYEVVKRLNLNVNYKTDGTFYKKTLYGDQLPIIVTFLDVDNNTTAHLTVQPDGKGSVKLTDFARDRETSKTTLTAKIGTKVKTPAGLVRVDYSPYNKMHEGLKAPVYVSLSGVNDAVNSNCGKLTVERSDKDASVIKLSFNDVNIQRAEEIVNTIITIYNENWIKDKNQISLSTNDFINERLKVIEEDLGHVDSDISSYKSANLVTDFAASAGMDMQQSNEAYRQIMDLNNQLSISKYLLNYLRAQQNKLLPANAGLSESNIQTLINSYNSTLLQRNRLVESSSEENLFVKDLDKELAATRNAIISSVENYIVSLNMQMKTSQSAQNQATSRISSNPVQAGQLLSVERQQKVKETLYLYLLQKREENELSQAFTAYNTRVVASPERTGSNSPTAPVRNKVLLIAIALGLAIPAGLLYLLESMDITVHGRKDLEKMNAPFAGEIPMAFHYKKTIAERIKRRFPILPIKLPKQAENNEFLVKDKSVNVINEAFRVVRTNVEFLAVPVDGKAAVLMVTSANPGSGKTFISSNLATALVIKGKKVLAIDLDLRKASLSAYADKPKDGVVNYLSGQESDYYHLIIKDVKGSGLDIMPVGVMPPNPAEMLTSSRLDTMIEDLKTKYDYIFIDCPPIEIVTDAAIIKRLVDGTLFIIRAGLFDKKALPQVDKLYTDQTYKNMMLILNATDGGGRYGYKYGYKYGYRYGYSYGYQYGYDKNDKD